MPTYNIPITIPDAPQSRVITTSVALSTQPTLASFQVEAGKRYKLEVFAHLESTGPQGIGADAVISFDGSSASWQQVAPASATIAELHSSGTLTPVYNTLAYMDRSAQFLVKALAPTSPAPNVVISAEGIVECWTSGNLNISGSKGSYATETNLYKFVATLTEVTAPDFVPAPPPNPYAD